eukprot:30824-Pelagococcus_subviridis.AAC.1
MGRALGNTASRTSRKLAASARGGACCGIASLQKSMHVRMSARNLRSIPGAWTFITTLREPCISESFARCTVPMLATPHGISSHSAIAPACPMRSSSRSTIARASPGRISVGAASCVRLHHSKYCGGTKSSRVDSSCAFLK